jgi:hypothetical protein
MSKLTVTGSGTHTLEETGLLDNIVNAITLPMKLFADDAAAVTFYSEGAAAQMQATGIAVGIAVGDTWGHKIPVLGQRRNKADAWTVG